MANKYCYFNGEIINFDEIKINPNDLGFLRGYGVFDAMRTVNRKPFLLDAHWDKLSSSVKELDMDMPISKEEFIVAIKGLLEKNKFKELSIRTIVSGGISENENKIVKGDKPTILIIAGDFSLTSPQKENLEKGIKAITLDFQRFLPRAKTLNYIAPIKEQKRKTESGAQEILYVNNGNALEGATSNLFIVKDKKLITARDNVLLGTMRDFVIKLVKENNLEVEEREIGTNELFLSDEAFITGSYKGVLPVVDVDGNIIGNGKVGDITKKIMALFEDYKKNF